MELQVRREGPAGAKAKDGPLDARDDGYVYAALQPGTVILSFEDETVAGTGLMKPQSTEIKFQILETRQVEITQI